MTPVIICKHNQISDACLPCAFEDLSDNLGAIHDAITATRGSAVRTTFVTGGAPSWEPLNLGAMSLLQDIVTDGRTLILGRRDNVTSAGSVLWLLERQAERLGAVDPLTVRTASKVGAWRKRADSILDRCKAPWPLPMDTVVDDEHGNSRHVTVQVGCPVVDPKVERPCSGKLFVHQADDLHAAWGESASITCSRDKAHTWSKARGGWVRLKVLLSVLERAA